MKKLILALTLGSLANGQEAPSTPSLDCTLLYKQAEKEAAASKSEDAAVLNMVRLYAQRYPDCLCEIVKAAIVGSEANKTLVKSVVETAIVASPDQFDTIVNCSIAIAPDAANEIAEVANQFSEDAATVAKKSNLLYLNGKNTFGGKNATSYGKNGGGKNGYDGQANESEVTEPFSTNALDNLGAGTNFANFSVDPGAGPEGITSTAATSANNPTSSTNLGSVFVAPPAVNPVTPDLTPSQP